MRTRADCRLCGSTRNAPVLSLGNSPLANEFVPESRRGIPQERFPLDIHLCQDCGHLQLLAVVDPDVLFRNYIYVSSTSPAFVDHFRRYAQELLTLTRMPRASQVVEIGSNDGVLLRFFQEAGMQVLGIDPARNIAQEATRRGIPTLPEFFTPDLAQDLRQQGWSASLVVANNVLAHADDLSSIVEGVRALLKPEGLFVFEVSYLADVVEKILFDTIYHEHLSYHSVKPLDLFFRRHEMEMVDALRVDSHGGSLRGFAQLKGGPFTRQPRLEALIQMEERLGLYQASTYQGMFQNIQKRKGELKGLLSSFKREGKKVVGYGAPAKATTLLFHFGIGPEEIEVILDDSPLKQGLFSPGHHIRVVSSSFLYEAQPPPDYALILAWNFAGPIIQKHQTFLDRGGHFIVPLPTLKVV